MIWALLVFLGVPLWLCAVGILILVLRTRALKNREGNIAVRVLKPGSARWRPGQAVWVSDVFAWRGSPAAWSEALLWAVDVSERQATPNELEKLRRLGDDPVIVEMSGSDGQTLTVAAAALGREALFGPFAPPG